MTDFESRTKKSQRIAAAVVSAVILLVMLFSVWFIAEEVHHDCTGEDCPVCASIVACAETLNLLSGGVSKPKVHVVLLLFTTAVTITAVAQVFLSNTLISQKIRQNN